MSAGQLPPLERVDLGEVPYQPTIEAMEGWREERRDESAPDRLFLLEHPPVVTYGRRTDPGDLDRLSRSGAIELVEVDRGGYATYHGPGQLVGYLVMSVRQRGPAGIIRWLEEGLIEAVGTLGYPALRRDTPKGASSLVGVWTQDGRKLASIGMRVRYGVSSHGFALNVDNDMAPWRSFVACGLSDVEMVSLAELAAEAGRPAPSRIAVRDAVCDALGAVVAPP